MTLYYNKRSTAAILDLTPTVTRYRIIDFEDGYRRGRISFSEIEKPFIELAKLNSGRKRTYDQITDMRQKIEYLRARAINRLVFAVLKVFKQQAKKIMEGKFEKPLLSLVPCISTLETIEHVSKQQVYRAPTVAHIEAAGFEVLGGLLGYLVPAITSKEPKRSLFEAKLLQLLPPEFLNGSSKYEKLLSATDFVSGMTDSFAVTLFRRLKGIELPQG
jgi:dGTPase